jgi:hypothetical protein
MYKKVLVKLKETERGKMHTSARKTVSKDKILELVYSLSEGELRL